MNHINIVCSVPSVEVLLSVIVVAITVAAFIVVPPALLREEVRVLLTTIEALVVLMSMEASIVASKLRIFLDSIVKAAESVLFVGASIVSSVIALILLH